MCQDYVSSEKQQNVRMTRGSFEKFDRSPIYVNLKKLHFLCLFSTNGIKIANHVFLTYIRVCYKTKSTLTLTCCNDAYHVVFKTLNYTHVSVVKARYQMRIRCLSCACCLLYIVTSTRQVVYNANILLCTSHSSHTSVGILAKCMMINESWKLHCAPLWPHCNYCMSTMMYELH